MAEHDVRMGLPPETPGRVKYLETCAKSKYVVDRLLDTNRSSPEGCRFVDLSDESFVAAYFIHGWHPTVCSKEKIRELIATTKPVQQVPDSLFLQIPK